ncbi:hypothetical protein [Lysobacter gummosus]
MRFPWKVQQKGGIQARRTIAASAGGAGATAPPTLRWGGRSGGASGLG